MIERKTRKAKEFWLNGKYKKLEDLEQIDDSFNSSSKRVGQSNTCMIWEKCISELFSDIRTESNNTDTNE